MQANPRLALSEAARNLAHSSLEGLSRTSGRQARRCQRGAVPQRLGLFRRRTQCHATAVASGWGAREADSTTEAAQSQGNPVHGKRGMASGAAQSRKWEAALAQACNRLSLSGAQDMQDFLACLILSECVYKKVELDQTELVANISTFINMFPPGWMQLEAVQASLGNVPQHYLIATGGDALYVAFMGTKQPRDLMADAAFLHQPVWAEAVALATDSQNVPAAHSGFLQRARAINVEQLYELAAASGKRLVLCGHSLGGAVAKLSALRLLRELSEWPAPRLKCMCFATPAVGNAALAELVRTAGWGSYFKTYFLPEDQVMRLVDFSQIRSSSTPPADKGAATAFPAAAAGGSKTEPATPLAAAAAATPEAGASSAHTASQLQGSPAETAPTAAGLAGASASVVAKRAHHSWVSTWPGRWPWPGLRSGVKACDQPMVLSSMDAAEAAVEDILSPVAAPLDTSSTGLQKVEPSGADSADVKPPVASHTVADRDRRVLGGADGAPAVASDTAPPFNFGLALALQRKRALRLLQKLADRARIPLPPPPMFHTFGAQLFLHNDQAYSTCDRPDPAAADTLLVKTAAATAHAHGLVVASSATTSNRTCTASDASNSAPPGKAGLGSRTASLSDLSHSVKGPFNYHRMVAHRLRVMNIISEMLPDDLREQHSMHPMNATASHMASATGTSSSTSVGNSRAAPTAVASDQAGCQSLKPQPTLRQRRRSSVRVQASDNLFPAVSMQRVVGRLPISLGASLDSPGSGLHTGADPARPTRHSLQGLGGLWPCDIRPEEEQVSLLLEVDGQHLQYCHEVHARLSMASSETTLPTEVVHTQCAQHPCPPGPGLQQLHPLSLLQNRLHQVAGSIGRYIGQGRSRQDLSGASANMPVTHMVVRISVPKAVAQQLLAASNPAGSPLQVPMLRLHVKSHFHEASMAVSIQPYKAAVLGTSLHAATLLQAALATPPSSTAATKGDGKAAAVATGDSGAASSAAAAAVAVRNAVLWWGAQPMRLAQRFWRPQMVRQAATERPPSSRGLGAAKASLQQTPVAAATVSQTGDCLSSSGTGVGSTASARSPGQGDAMQPGFAVRKRRASESAAVDLIAGPAKVGGRVRAISSDGSVPAAAEEYELADGMSLLNQHDRQEQQVKPRRFSSPLFRLPELHPVASLYLMMAFVRQATTRLVATRRVRNMVSNSAASWLVGGGASANATADMPAAAAVLMRRRPTSYAASIAMQKATDAEMAAAPAEAAAPPVQSMRWGPVLHLLPMHFRLPWRSLKALHAVAVGSGSRRRRGAWWRRNPGWLSQGGWSPFRRQFVGSPRAEQVPLLASQLCQIIRGRDQVPCCNTNKEVLSGSLAEGDAGAGISPAASVKVPLLRRAHSAQDSLNVGSSAPTQPSCDTVVTGPPLVPAAASLAQPLLRRSFSYSSVAVGSSKAHSKQAAAKKLTQPIAAPSRASGTSSPPHQVSVSKPQAASRRRQLSRQASTASSAALLGVPAACSCLDGSVVVHNVLASAPGTSPFVMLRAMTAALRRQAAALHNPWWSGVLSRLPSWQRQVAPARQQQQQPHKQLRPAVPLLHLYNFIRAIPFWIQQRRSGASLTLDQDWKLLVVVASALDPTRLLQGRDFARMVLRAQAAEVSLLPVLLTSPEVPELQQDSARQALAAACGVSPALVRLVVMEDALLRLSEAPVHAEEVAGRVAGRSPAAFEGWLERARRLASCAPGADGVRRQLQALLLQGQLGRLPGGPEGGAQPVMSGARSRL